MIFDIILCLFLHCFVSYSIQLNPNSPKWVGAWWIGFIFAAALSFVVSLGLCGFPKYLPGRKAVLKLKASSFCL